MMGADDQSWNVRDLHMSDILDRLTDHHGPDAKAIVWAHNTHVGDARATDMAGAGTLNVGQVTRERHGTDDVVLVGFGSHRGYVFAAEGRDGPMERLPVPAAPAGNHEDLLHQAAPAQSLLVFPRSGSPRGSPTRADIARSGLSITLSWTTSGTGFPLKWVAATTPSASSTRPTPFILWIWERRQHEHLSLSVEYLTPIW